MNQEQKELVVDNIKEAMASGLDNWWEAFVNASRVLAHKPIEELSEQEQKQIDAWYMMFMEAHAGIIQGNDTVYTLDMFYDMISTKWGNRRDENWAITHLLNRCKDEGVFTAEVVEIQKYGY